MRNHSKRNCHIHIFDDQKNEERSRVVFVFCLNKWYFFYLHRAPLQSYCLSRQNNDLHIVTDIKAICTCSARLGFEPWRGDLNSIVSRHPNPLGHAKLSVTWKTVIHYCVLLPFVTIQSAIVTSIFSTIRKMRKDREFYSCFASTNDICFIYIALPFNLIKMFQKYEYPQLLWPRG